ncbi:MAG: phosphate-starvation-inducible PsiE family protein [Syntrophales bacterium]|nr:phosphate-starvation-inducible PsiE family protein [Syntrophales bacterium]
MSKYLKIFERIIVYALLIMMAITIFLATVDLGWIMVKDILTPPLFLISVNELLEIFGMFLLVLIGIELLETIKTYSAESKVHLEVVLMVAMIAIARKVIILDLKEISNLTLMGLAALIIALSVGYYLIKREHKL